MVEKILITGIPGCGKSTFGRWLREKHGYFFVDMEAEPGEPDSLDRASLRASWEAFVSGENRVTFLQEVSSRSPIVLDWGFPLGCSHLVSALIRGGINAFWFEGDRLTARQHFIKRNTRPVLEFDIQFSNIAGNWELLENMFQNHVIRVALPNGSIQDPEKIFEIIKAA